MEQLDVCKINWMTHNEFSTNIWIPTPIPNIFRRFKNQNCLEISIMDRQGVFSIESEVWNQRLDLKKLEQYETEIGCHLLSNYDLLPEPGLTVGIEIVRFDKVYEWEINDLVGFDQCYYTWDDASLKLITVEGEFAHVITIPRKKLLI